MSIHIEKGSAIICDGEQHLIAIAKRDIEIGDKVSPNQFDWYIRKPEDGDRFSMCPKCKHINSFYIKWAYGEGIKINVAGRGWI